MAFPQPPRRFAPIMLPRLPSDLGQDPILAGCWLVETWLTWVRWAAVPLCLAVIPAAPSESRWWFVLLALGFGLGNLAVAEPLSREPTAAGWHTVRQRATVLEWAAAAGAIALFARGHYRIAPAILVIVVFTTGLRYRKAGALVAACGAELILAALLMLQGRLLVEADGTTVVNLLIVWGSLLAMTALVVGGIVRAGSAWGCWLQTLHHDRGSDVHESSCELSPRELALLPWLDHPELTYKEIGAALDPRVSATTVKAHVQNIGRRLGVQGDRWIVVEAARQRGLLPPASAPSGAAMPLTQSKGQDGGGGRTPRRHGAYAQELIENTPSGE